MLDEDFGAESAHVAKGRGVMQGGNEGVMGHRWDIHSSFVVKASVLKGPLLYGRAGKQG